MRAVVQRVSSAQVTVGTRIVGEIGCGLLVFVGVEAADDGSDVAYMASKVSDLRVFEDVADAGRGRMNRSVRDVGGAVLLVSQFTLHGDCRRGRRPSFDRAARPELARILYDQLALALQELDVPVETGEFQAKMRVELVNDGPVTLLLDSKRAF